MGSAQHRELGAQLGHRTTTLHALGVVLPLRARRRPRIGARHPITLVHFEGAVLFSARAAHDLSRPASQQLPFLAAAEQGQDRVGAFEPSQTRLEDIAIDGLQAS